MSFTRDALLGTWQRRFKEVPLPNGVTVRIRSVNEAERQAWEAALYNKKHEMIASRANEIRLRYIVLCVVDDHGDPLFTTEDIPALASKLDSGLVMFLSNEIRKHCGWDDTDVEALAKNYGTTLGGDSPSG